MTAKLGVEGGRGEARTVVREDRRRGGRRAEEEPSAPLTLAQDALGLREGVPPSLALLLSLRIGQSATGWGPPSRGLSLGIGLSEGA